MRVISPIPCCSQRAAASGENALSSTSAVHHTQPSCASFSSIVMRASNVSMSTRAALHAAVSGAKRSKQELFPYRLGVDLEADLVADDHAAAFEHRVPLEAPVLAADLGGSAEPGALVAPRRGDRAEVLEIE